LFQVPQQVWLDVAIEALKRYMALPSDKQDIDSLMHFTRHNYSLVKLSFDKLSY